MQYTTISYQIDLGRTFHIPLERICAKEEDYHKYFVMYIIGNPTY